MLQLTFLGTSAGVPTLERNVSGLALTPLCLGKQSGWFLIDCGEGTQQRLQHTKLSLQKLRAIFITHAHGDHCFGLPGLLTSMSMFARTEKLVLVAPQEILDWVSCSLMATDSYLNYEVEYIDVLSIAAEAVLNLLELETVKIVSYPLAHRVKSYAYSFEIKNVKKILKVQALEDLGLPKSHLWRDLQEGRDVLYAGRLFLSSEYVDVHDIISRVVVAGDNAEPRLLRDACRHADLLVHESTYDHATLEKVGLGRMHSSAKLVAEFASEIGLPNTILTHFSARYHQPEDLKILKNEAEQANPNHRVFFANDLDCFHLDAQGVVYLHSHLFKKRG